VQDGPRSRQPKHAKEESICGQIMNLGALRSKIRCETNSRRRLQESVWGKKTQTLA
jgi:hypothetical protein